MFRYIATVSWLIMAWLYVRMTWVSSIGPRVAWRVAAAGMVVLALAAWTESLSVRYVGDALLYGGLTVLFIAYYRRWRADRRERRERRSEFADALQSVVKGWTCPRCKTQDLRLIDIETVVVECAECRYRTDPLPAWARPTL